MTALEHDLTLARLRRGLSAIRRTQGSGRCYRPRVLSRGAFICLTLMCFVSLAVGCGEDGKETQPVTSAAEGAQNQAAPTAASTQPAARAVPKRRYLRRANAICRDLFAQAGRVRREDFFNVRRRDLRHGFERLSTLVGAALRRFRQLGMPNGERASAHRLLSEIAKSLATLERATRDRRLATRVVQGGVDPLRGAAAAAQAIGIRGCVAL